ncbi:MAG: Hint domain-containing protein [Labilithrix sp.]|nr:Hint domain-containing protein [Labilithrix sp.]
MGIRSMLAKHARGASFVDCMVVVALAIGLVLIAARLWDQAYGSGSAVLADKVKTTTAAPPVATTREMTNGAVGVAPASTGATCDALRGCEAPASTRATRSSPEPTEAPDDAHRGRAGEPGFPRGDVTVGPNAFAESLDLPSSAARHASWQGLSGADIDALRAQADALRASLAAEIEALVAAAIENARGPRATEVRAQIAAAEREAAELERQAAEIEGSIWPWNWGRAEALRRAAAEARFRARSLAGHELRQAALAELSAEERARIQAAQDRLARVEQARRDLQHADLPPFLVAAMPDPTIEPRWRSIAFAALTPADRARAWAIQAAQTAELAAFEAFEAGLASHPQRAAIERALAEAKAALRREVLARLPPEARAAFEAAFEIRAMIDEDGRIVVRYVPTAATRRLQAEQALALGLDARGYEGRRLTPFDAPATSDEALLWWLMYGSTPPERLATRIIPPDDSIRDVTLEVFSLVPVGTLASVGVMTIRQLVVAGGREIAINVAVTVVTSQIAETYGPAGGSQLATLATALLTRRYASAVRVAPHAVDDLRPQPSCTAGVCTGGSCFIAGTKVVTPDGPRAIEELSAGDVVVARDPETGETAPRRVARTFVTRDREVVQIDVERDGARDRLVATPEHPFFVEGRGFRRVGDLAPGDVVRATTGTARVVALASLPDRVTVYNFEVESAHTYFVGASEVWVHNQCTPSPALRGTPYSPEKVAERQAFWRQRYGVGPRMSAREFEASLVGLPHGEARARIAAMTERVAQERGWIVDRAIARKNPGRTIYTDPATGLHYSVDFRHGRFELLGRNGRQIGEVDIDLRVMKNKFDNTGGHDIIVRAELPANGVPRGPTRSPIPREDVPEKPRWEAARTA